MKEDFKAFKIGTVFNPLWLKAKKGKPKFKGITINYPSRINAMALDPGQIAKNKNMVYTPGEIIFTVGIFKKITVKTKDRASGGLVISDRSRRKQLVRHAFLLMEKALGFGESLYIDVDNKAEIKHSGLGSSSGLISGVCAAINELYGNPIPLDKLARYAAQNHGEEIEGDDNNLMPVQCIGGSAIGGYFNGGMKIVAGETCLIKAVNLPARYKVVLGIPKDFKPLDSKVLLELEIKNFRKFLNTGLKYKEKIAYNILHKMLPAMVEKDLEMIGDVIFEYRFKMGSIKNCSFVYPKLIKITNNLSRLKRKGLAEILAISSVGPGVFAITKKPKLCEKEFKKNNLTTRIIKIENNRYKIIRKW